jgi:2-oxoglutarate ferredoxin oxidoreductase subunit alpha
MRCQGLLDDTISIIIGGEAGQGISRSGALLGKAIMRCGFHAFGAIDYPSLIRGGHNFYQLRVSERQVFSATNHIDILIALNDDTINKHIEHIVESGGVIYDENTALESESLRDDISFYPIPLTQIVNELKGPIIMRNTIALGAAAALIGLNSEILKDVVTETFVGRPNISDMNRRGIDKGYEYLIGKDTRFQCRLEQEKRPNRIWLTGNEAIAMGAITAGCQFYSAYPMTPASPLLHYLVAHEEVNDMVVIQAENELAAMCMAVGASFTGVRSMTSTSGGGFCLMTEALSFAAMTETPVVVMIGQRPGPSTGLATYSSQQDLLFSIYAGHGEFQRVVLAPGDVDQCFYLTSEAFNLAEKFQIPVIILGDKSLIESYSTTNPFEAKKVKIDRGEYLSEWNTEEPYKRYKITESGISPRAVLGTKNTITLANSNEHIETGHGTSRSEPTKQMVDKRFRKVKHIEQAIKSLKPVRKYGSEDPDITLIGWGSTKGPILEAMKLLEMEGIKSRLIQPVVMEPFPKDISKYLVGNVILFETNRTAQLGTLIKLHTGYKFQNVSLRYDGRPLDPDEIRDKVLEVNS